MEVLGGQGNLATIHFKLLKGGGTGSDVTVKNCKIYGPGEEGELLAVTAVAGRVTVAGSGSGSAPGSGGVPWVPLGVGGGVLLLVIVFLALRSAGAPAPGRTAAAASGGSCVKCGTPWRAGAQFCDKCGSARS